MADKIGVTDRFYGINKNPFRQNGEQAAANNMSNEDFPYLKSRKTNKPYKIEAAIAATLGDGVDYEGSTEPEASRDTLGQIWHYIPDDEMLKAGKVYQYSDGEYNEINELSGIVTELPCENLSVDSINKSDRASRKRETDRIGETYRLVKSDSAKNYKYSVTEAEHFYFKETDVRPSGFSIKTLHDYDPGSEFKPGVGLMEYYISYRGDTRTLYGITFENNKNYVVFVKYAYEWVEQDNYSVVTAAPESPSAGTKYIYCATNLLQNGKVYKPMADYSGGGIFYYAEADETRGTDAATLPEIVSYNEYDAVKDNRYKYTGASTTEECYKECKKSNDAYTWELTEKPYVIHEYSIKEYFADIKAEFTLKKVSDVCEINGELAAVICDTDGKTYLYYKKAAYAIPYIGESDTVKLLPFGEMLLVSECGAVFNTENLTWDVTRAKFSYSVQCDYHRNTGSGREYISQCEDSHIYIYSQNKNLLDDIAAKIKEDTAFYIERENGTSYAFTATLDAVVTDSSYGYKIGDKWVDVPLWRLHINVAQNEQMQFRDEEIRIYSNGIVDVVAWKKRLWGYEDDTIRGTVLDIIKNNNIDWDTVENLETDSFLSKQWQGGDITGICSTENAVIFFHRNYIDVLSGNTKSTLYVSQHRCAGLKNINVKSIVNNNDYIYYFGDNGVNVYFGGIAKNISEELKLENLNNVIGGSDGKRYYFTDGSDTYVYDYKIRCWQKYENTVFNAMCMIDGKRITAVGDEILTEGNEYTKPWEIVLEYREDTVMMKKYKAIYIDGEFGAASVYIGCDDAPMRAIGVIRSNTKLKLEHPVICDKLTIRLCGEGKCLLRQIKRVYEVVDV